MSLPRRHAPSTDLLSRLIERPDVARLVRSLPTDRFSALVREIGIEDAGEIVALATTEQLVAAFDEDLFVNARPGEREAFDRRRFVTWLEVLMEAGDHAVARRLTELSEDFVAHALSNMVFVFDYEELRDRIGRSRRGAAADRALDHALNEEIEGYLLVARDDEGWDAVLALVLALDRDHRSLLVRILDRCAAAARPHLDDFDELTEILSNAESLAEDVEAEREDRRSAAGYVEPRAAKSFLTLARTPVDDLANAPRDPVTRAYFRRFERAPKPESVPAEVDVVERALAALPAADAPAPEDAPQLVAALQVLAEGSPARFEARLEELAYLANVIQAGLAIGDRRLRPAEAAQAALATVALGAELVLRERGLASSPEALQTMLDEHSADLLFRRGSSALAAAGCEPAIVRSREELDAFLK
jgi:hypothetical protein